MIAVACPSCGKELQAPDAAAGKNAKCGKCGTRFKVPEKMTAAVARPSVAPAARAAITVASPPTIEPEIVRQARQVECPFCDELISPNAKKCRYCGEVLDPQLRAVEEARRVAERPQAAPNVVNQSTAVVVNNGRQGGGIATGALAIGLLAVLLCWLPVVAIPLALLGLAAAALAFFVGIFNYGTGMPRAVAAGVICLAAIGLSGYMTYHASKSIMSGVHDARERARAANQLQDASP